jgi:SAM-dependent methyltransferase
MKQKSLKQEEKVSRFFSDFAGDWDALYGGKRNKFWRVFDRIFRYDVLERFQITMERLGADLTQKTVLDIGCGSGVYDIEIARRGATKVLGIDLSPGMIALAKEFSRRAGSDDRCEFVCANFPPDPPIQALSRTFDYGVAMGVMDYISDPVSFLRQTRSLITQFVILSFPGRHWLREPLRRYRYRLLGRCELYNYDEPTIRAACKEAGFRSVNIQRLNHSGICYIVTASP